MHQDTRRFAIVIPVFNHGHTVADVVNSALALGWPVYVVDDGSTDGWNDEFKSIEGVHLLKHPVNQGKGAALITGMWAAAEHANWVITLDADGQHFPKDALNLIEAIPEDDRPIVLGRRLRMSAEEVPWTSRFGREFSNFWVRMAGGPRVSDSQSGFRLYPLPETLQLDVRAKRYQFEIEVLVKAAWAGIGVIESPVGVYYPKGTERVSHFRPFIDFLRNTATFTRLISRCVLFGRPRVNKGN